MSELHQLPWCHIYGQHSWHMPATIEGTREALTAIRDAIDVALSRGMNSSASLFASDGEGYHVEIAVRNYDYLRDSKLPYLAPYAGGMGAALFEQERELTKPFNTET